MCNKCYCKNYEKCSIVGSMPFGFCCSKCHFYDESQICLNTKTKSKTPLSMNNENRMNKIHPISTIIEGEVLKVFIRNKDKKIPIIIDLKKYLKSN